ncbi:MAG: hypothetical protein ACRDP6_44345 [Actinoallomurus sp.]
MTARSQAEQTEAALREAGKRLDDALTAILEDTPGLNWKSWVAKATAAGYKLSTETVRAVRRGDYAPTPPVARAIEYMAGWASGSVEAVRVGGHPTPLQAAASDDREPRPPQYDDPALQAVWDLDELLDEDERRAAIMAVQVIRDQKRRADTARAARA